ncbi:TetR/AcrR family transcriptional regulator [Williamsia sp. R60]
MTTVTGLLEYKPTNNDDRVRQTRRAIAEAAAQVFRSHGYGGATVSAVAAVAGVNPRTLYRHYGSKSALFAATVALGTTDFLATFADRVSEQPLCDALVSAFMETAPETTPECQQLVALVWSEDDVRQYWLASSYRIQPYLASTLHSVATGRVPTDGPGREADIAWLARAGCIIAAFNTAYQLWAASEVGASLEQIVRMAVATIEPALGLPQRGERQLSSK